MVLLKYSSETLSAPSHSLSPTIKTNFILSLYTLLSTVVEEEGSWLRHDAPWNLSTHLPHSDAHVEKPESEEHK